MAVVFGLLCPRFSYDDAQVHAVLEELGGGGMPEVVHVGLLVETALAHGALEDGLQGAAGDRNSHKGERWVIQSSRSSSRVARGSGT